MQTSAGGRVSFKKKGRLDAVLVRLENTNVMLLATHGQHLTLPAGSLSDNDRAYLRKANGIDEAEASGSKQTALVKNEMSRRRAEAAKLREEATTDRKLSSMELDAAEKLENEAARLASRAGSLETQARSQAATADNIDGSVVTSAPARRAKGDAAIITSAAEQLEQDADKLRKQSQEKRGKATRLSNEAANLEQTAQSIETNATDQ